ncbi:MAG TPA: hypothetical protein VNQ90_08570 [Chthoniobacteraceae bacterium]|nr:hypothetical protein [Chthoniobacteraceae bacterium]
MKTPWIFKFCPTRYLPLLEKLAFAIGSIGLAAFHLGGMVAIMFGPLVFAILQPDAPISQPVLWLRQYAGKDEFLLIYSFIQIPITVILFYSMQLLDYLRIRNLLALHGDSQTDATKTKRAETGQAGGI